jgi:hypothetical protein
MASFIPIDIDLNTLFEAKLTYGFDPLKQAIAVSRCGRPSDCDVAVVCATDACKPLASSTVAFNADGNARVGAAGPLLAAAG